MVQHTERCYNEKLNTLFVYVKQEDVMKWVMCDNAMFRKSCTLIASKFIELFVHWQSENDDYVLSSVEAQEQNMHFMQKPWILVIIRRLILIK